MSNPNMEGMKMEKGKVQPTRYLREIEAGKVLALSPGHLRNLRVKGQGPEFVKFGKAVRYDWRALMAWADAMKAAMKN
jgi:hypothetical protein